MYIPHLLRVKSHARQQAVLSMFVTYACVYVHMYVERPRWCAQRGPERRSERSREDQRGPMGPKEKTRQDVFQKSPEGPERPREAQNEKIRPREAWRGLKRVREGQRE